MKNRKKDIGKGYISDIGVESIFPSHDLMAMNIDCSYMPLSDIIEMPQSFIIEMELPGVDKKDIKIEVLEHTIVVSGNKHKFEKSDEKKDKKHFHCMGRVYGKFKRSFNIPSPFNMHEIKAKLEKGVLVINIPKLDEKRAKKIIIPVE